MRNNIEVDGVQNYGASSKADIVRGKCTGLVIHHPQC